MNMMRNDEIFTSNSELACPDYCIYDAGYNCKLCSRLTNTRYWRNKMEIQIYSDNSNIYIHQGKDNEIFRYHHNWEQIKVILEILKVLLPKLGITPKFYTEY